MAQPHPVNGRAARRIRTLAIDVGGTHLKASVVNERGRLLDEPVRIDTPVGSPPGAIVQALVKLVAPLGAFDRVSVGFPGVLRGGRVLTAPNLEHPEWKGFELDAALAHALGKPVRSGNDADVQGLGVIAGHGVEMIITLGTGFGTGLYVDGRPAPHLELGHHPFRKGKSYEELLSNAARKQAGNKKWNKRLKKAIDTIRALVTFDHLYIGGGNAKKVDLDLPRDVTVVDNVAGIAGGIRLWQDADRSGSTRNTSVT